MNDTKNEQIDEQVQQILDVLAEYKDSHPNADIAAKRQNSVSIRVRIIDSDFEGMDRVDRDPLIWTMLKTLPDDVFSNITMLLLLTPKEAETSLANLEFDDPLPSRL